MSWITLEVTGSLFLVGVVAAVRMAPQIPFGIPAGIIADWINRRSLVVGVTTASAIVALVVATLAATGWLVFPVILTVAIALGLLDTMRTTASQAYAYDLVHAAHVARGLAFVNLGAQLLGAAGGLAGGYALQEYGGATAFLIVAIVLAWGATVPLLAVGENGTSGATGNATVSPPRRRPSFVAAGTLIGRSRLVAMLVLTIILAEVLGFSSATMMPKFARDVFKIGAAGLGIMTASRSVGGVVSLLLLSRIGTRERSGRVMLGAAGVLGLALLAFAASPVLEVALVWLALVGAACAVMDTMSQMLLQQAAGERERGAAMGLWVVSIGFAPLGHLALGALGDTVGAPPTQALFGASLAIAAVLLALYRPLRALP